ncbi:hypothetical protein PVK06_022576 [Gossypium arboreum]|uniref:Pentatricopeptide repeat-containing protein n=1 Tax=Gossypium arboreum TaxID=29729 RepID=A0ABR0P8Z9_GOSAR|nr:hypothetical protein PVK06_022576 [Gossypium arboreum]
MRDLVSWTAMITAYEQAEQPDKALLLFQYMQLHGVLSDSVTIDTVKMVKLVKLCFFLRLSTFRKEIPRFCYKRIKIDANLCNALMDMYVNSGDLDTATRLFNDIPPTERNITSWNVLISGYDMHGYGKEALNLFSQMQQTGIKPDHITFTSLLSACGHAGLIDEGRKCFAEMKKHSESLRVKHYACMVDILGRAGLLNQAFDMVQQITIPKNDGV